MEKVNDKQLKKMAKVFRRTGRTFQDLAAEAGLRNIPDHASELMHSEARHFLKYYSFYLIAPYETKKE